MLLFDILCEFIGCIPGHFVFTQDIMDNWQFLKLKSFPLCDIIFVVVSTGLYAVHLFDVLLVCFQLHLTLSAAWSCWSRNGSKTTCLWRKSLSGTRSRWNPWKRNRRSAFAPQIPHFFLWSRSGWNEVTKNKTVVLGILSKLIINLTNLINYDLRIQIHHAVPPE